MREAIIAVAIVVALSALLVLLLYAVPRTSAAQGMLFNGSRYLLYNASVNGNFTVSVWLNYSEFNGTGVAVAQGIGENEHSDWYVGTGGEVGPKTTCGVFSDERVEGNYTAGWRFAEAPFIGTHKWHNIICVYNGTYITMYIDGRLANVTATPYSMAVGRIIEVGKRTSTFYINGSQTFAPFFGRLANLQVYDNAVNSSGAARIYKLGISGKPWTEATFYMPMTNSSDFACFYYGQNCIAQSFALR